MGKTSNKSKQEWNTTHYVQLKISVKPDIAKAFKIACIANNVSMASQISQFMLDYCNLKAKPNISEDFTKKANRRACVKSIIQQLELIKDSEERYRDNIPDNLQGSIVYERAECSISVLEEAIEMLTSAY